MSGTNRDSSHIDDDIKNDNNQSQPEISNSPHTPADSQQNPIYIPSTSPSTSPVQSAMSTPVSTGDRPTETSNDNETAGSSSPSNAPAKKGHGRRGQSKNKNSETSTEDETAETRPRKRRRRKDEPEPDYVAEMLQKKNKSGRVAQACVRCHKGRFKCDDSRGGCVSCLSSGYVCIMVNRVTKEVTIRGGVEGEKTNFAQVHNDLKENNGQLNQEVERLRTENESLRNQLQYYQNFTSSIGANVQIPGPNNAPPVSMLSGNFPNPQPQAMQQPNPNPHLNTNPQPFPSNYNNSAFSGNMSINTPSTVPHLSFGTPMSNALQFPQWAQPHLPQGLPGALQNTAAAYTPNFYQTPPLQNNQFQGIPFQNANNQGMGYQGVSMQNFQFTPGFQVPGTQYLPMSRPLGTQSSNAQNQNQNQSNPANQGVQATPAQRQPSQSQIANTQGQNNRNDQGQPNPAQTTNPNQGMGYSQNQMTQNQNLQPMTTQYLGHQMQNTNAQNKSMGNSNTLSQGIQVPNTQAHNMNTQNPGSQYPNNIQFQSQSANAHQNFANANLLNQMPQPSLFGNTQNQGIQFQHPQVFQQPSFQVPGTQYQNITAQGQGVQGLGYVSSQNPFLQGPRPTTVPNNPGEGGGSSGNDADAEGESESEEYNWTPPPRSGGQYVTANTERQQTNTGDNNNNRQGEQNTLPNTTTTNIQTQTVPTETLGGFGNPFDLTDTENTLNNDILDQAPDLSSSEMQRLLGELEGTRYDYTQGEQNNGDNNGGQEEYQETICKREIDIKSEIEVKLESIMTYIKEEKA